MTLTSCKKIRLQQVISFYQNRPLFATGFSYYPQVRPKTCRHFFSSLSGFIQRRFMVCGEIGLQILKFPIRQADALYIVPGAL